MVDIYKLELVITYIVLEEAGALVGYHETMEFAKKVLLCFLRMIRIFVIHVCITSLLDLVIFGPLETAIGRIFEDEAEAGGVGGGGRGGRGVSGDGGEAGVTG